MRLSKSCALELSSMVCKRLEEGGVGVGYSEMMRCLGYVEEGEVERESVMSSVGCVLPWCGVVVEGNCSALKLNNGLHTQCNKLKENNKEYCKSCEGSVRRNGGGAPYGSVSERLKVDILDYIDPKGRMTIPYANVMKKLNISREEAEVEAKKLGWSIPECHFNEKKGKRGRPKKDTSAEDTASECSVEKKKRGRPKKEKAVVCNNVGEELIASLVSEQTCVSEETSGCKETELLPENINEEEEEEEETNVVKFEINGKIYLKSEDNILFDINSHDAIGVWNEETSDIGELPDEDDE